MKTGLVAYICICICLLSSCSIRKAHSGKSETHSRNIQAAHACYTSTDSLYDYTSTINQIAKFLNASIPEYQVVFGDDRGFWLNLEDCRLVGFSIFDLNDPSNHSGLWNDSLGVMRDSVSFKEKHIYHFHANYPPFSFSNIVFLEAGRIQIFEAINCTDRGDSLEKVLSYLAPRLTRSPDKKVILERVRDYRQYGSYGLIDDIVPSLDCPCEPCYLPE